jgi:hypothetical protein
MRGSNLALRFDASVANRRAVYGCNEYRMKPRGF